MDADDRHFFIIGSVEDSDPAALRQIAGRAPQGVMLQFSSTGMLEAEHLAPLGNAMPSHRLDHGRRCAVYGSGQPCAKDGIDNYPGANQTFGGEGHAFAGP